MANLKKNARLDSMLPQLVKQSLTTLLLVGFTWCASASDEPITLNLQEAEQIAVTNHPRITAAQLIALASKQVVREARSAFFPTITANATAVDATASNTRIAAGGLNNPLILTRNAEGVIINQLITDFGRTANLTESSKLHARAQEENALATRAQIVLQLDAAYFDALQAQTVLGVAQQTVDTRQLLFDQISEKATNQLKSGLDVSFARVSLGESKVLLANARNDVEASFDRLANLLGERQHHTYKLLDQPISTNALPDAEQSIALALRDRPDLAQSRYERDAAERFARAEHDLHLPTISAIGSAGIIPDHDSTMRANYAAAGVNLSFPIFDGMLFTARTKEAELRARAATENLRDAEDNIIRDVRIAVLNLNYAAEQMALTADLLASANEAYDLAQARYNNALSSIVELSQAQLSQTQAQISQARAKFDFQIRSAALAYQTGQIK